MDYFVFDFDKHSFLVDSYLESASLAYKQERKSKDWFKWKFRDNPFGKTILACAEDKKNIVGCVAYGLQNFINSNQAKGTYTATWNGRNESGNPLTDGMYFYRMIVRTNNSNKVYTRKLILLK